MVLFCIVGWILWADGDGLWLKAQGMFIFAIYVCLDLHLQILLLKCVSLLNSNYNRISQGKHA